MTTELAGIDSEDLPLDEWLQSPHAIALQRDMEERIFHFLFNPNLPEDRFSEAVQMLAWMGSSDAEKTFLQRDIFDLNKAEILPFGLGKTCQKIGRFIAEHKGKILVGAALCATGVGIAAAAGYACTISIGGIAVAGAGAIFSRDPWKPSLPNIPPPASKPEIAIASTSPFSYVSKLQFPSSETELLVTREGIWANQEFYSNEKLLDGSRFASEINPWTKLPKEEKPLEPDLFPSMLAAAETKPTENQPEVPPRISYQPQDFCSDPVQPPGFHRPRKSLAFTIEGKKTPPHCKIAWINGINNTFEESTDSAAYIQKLAGGATIKGIYNCSHGPVIDVLEAGVLNYQGHSPNTAKLLKREWEKFHQVNKERPNAKLLQICHSQGTIDVKNALFQSSPEIQDRIIVVAIAPAAVVSKNVCFESYNFASENDFVYKLEPAPQRPITSLTFDDVLVPTFGALEDHRDELIILSPHPDAQGIDHTFQSKTYMPVLKQLLNEYERQQGEYPPRNRDE